MSASDPQAADDAPRREAGTGPHWPEVRNFLQTEPQHLLCDQELLETLGLRHAAPNVVDLGRAALTRLEAVAARETDARRQIEQVARANYAAQAQTHAVVVELLDSRSHADLARRLDTAARHRFGLAAGVLALERPGPVPFGWRALEAGGVDRLLGPDGLSRLGPGAGDADLWGPDVERVKSAALVRMALWSPARFAVCAFGSSEPDAFSPEMGAELVAFLTRVVERTAERWPVL